MAKRRNPNIFSFKSKTKGVRYRARAFDSNKKPYHETHDTLQEAKDWLAQERVRNKDGSVFRDAKRVTFEEYFNYFIEEITPYKETKTIVGYKGNVENHIYPFLKTKRLSEITYQDGIDLQKALSQKKVAKKYLNNKTNNQVLKLLKQILLYATIGQGKRKQLHINPLNGLALLPETDKKFEFWEKGEVAKFLKMARWSKKILF